MKTISTAGVSTCEQELSKFLAPYLEEGRLTSEEIERLKLAFKVSWQKSKEQTLQFLEAIGNGDQNVQ